ncbi:MAG: aspartate kinase [Candidatus Nitrosopumilus limneticus]|nr:putative aspartokinase [Candidatus Nitrosopumilus limneticus]MSS86417.1 aspartate kinase [Nitrosopumilus sp.]PHY04140.1 MAG: aspartate kinase [Nitrososphaerota archaeon]MDC4212023.1 aspartate kinase [Candidatus Nitrosopumilus limneticus]MDC4213715.1 aspartate kinase [Candidatus Nitrosopumilus limneticus]
MKLVLKYGGTSISSAKDIQEVAKHVATLSKKHEIVLVCSATSSTTDDLIEISESIKKENKSKAEQLASKITNRHKQLAKQTIKKTDIQKKLLLKLDDDFTELLALIDGLVLLGEVTPRSMDYLISFGERISVKIVAAAINDLTKKSIPLTGKELGIVTDSNFSKSQPLMDTTRLRVSKNIDTLFSKKIIPVVGGFSGADQYGHTTTFGRGGSDYSATIIGSCIKADEIWLMSDVDGLMTADPKIVKNAKLLKEVSYIEAIEMALFGAKQIHPRTFEPLLAKKIPMKIRNSATPSIEGTLVTSSPSDSVKNTVKCVSSIRNNGLIDIIGGSMIGTPGTAAKIFTTLAKAEINVMMISQNPSESSITIVIKNTDLHKAVNVLEIELLGKMIKELQVTTDVSIIALIGSGMRGTIGVASKVFAAIEKNKVNVSMITQGSSELNLAFVVKNSDTDLAVRAIHDAFELDKIN